MPSGNRNDRRYNSLRNNQRNSSNDDNYTGSRNNIYSRNRQLANRQIIRKRRVRGKAVKSAQSQLKRFRQGSILAVALTSFLLILLIPGEAGFYEGAPVQVEDTTRTTDQTGINTREVPDTVSIIEDIAVEDLLYAEDPVDTATADEDIGRATKNMAVQTIRNLRDGLNQNLPKVLVAIATLLIAWLFIRLLKFLLRKAFKRNSGSQATITIISICAWLFAAGLAVSIIAGDIRALVGSLGLIGLALSWSLQTPIESFTGWLLNSFRGYYRVGDRISVGEVFGDVYKIDFLTTTVWEIGAPFRSGFVQAEQPTGRLVTFPNNEILTGVVINLTGDFPYVWDELSTGIAHESDIPLAMSVIEQTADKLLGDYMKEPASIYQSALRKAKLDYPVSDKPQVYISVGESWTEIIVRYLVGARERRKWKSQLSLSISQELTNPKYKNKILPVYPRHQVQFVDKGGRPVNREK